MSQKLFTDKELEEIAFQEQFLLFCDMDEFKDIARFIERLVSARFNPTRIEELESEYSDMSHLAASYLGRANAVEHERDSLLADNARLRNALHFAHEELRGWYEEATGEDYNSVEINEALAATPAQSLARHNNSIRRECATAGGPEDSYQDEWFKAKADSAARILAMMEPE